MNLYQHVCRPNSSTAPSCYARKLADEQFHFTHTRDLSLSASQGDSTPGKNIETLCSPFVSF